MKKKKVIKKKDFSKYLLQAVLFLLVIFIPSNLFLTLSTQNAFVDGLRVDYLIPKLYASQLLILGLCGIWIFRLIKKGQKISFSPIKNIIYSNQLLVVAVFFLLIKQFFFTQPTSSLWFVFQTITSILLYIFLYYHRWLLKKISFGWAIFTSLIMQTTLAIYQFILQRPLLPYQCFGEPRFEPYFTISRHLFAGKEKILAYGSTAHPNVLAGTAVFFCLILLWITLQKKTRINWIRWIISLLATGIILYTSQSFSALLTLIIGTGLFFIRSQASKFSKSNHLIKWLLALFIFIIILVPVIVSKQADRILQEPSLTRRQQLNQAAINIFKNNFLWGVGLNQFTLHLEKYTSSSEVVRFIQPAHHTSLLLLAEAGILGIAVVAMIFKKLNNQHKRQILFGLIIISPILALDHYLYTLQTGQLLITLILVFLSPRRRS